MVSSSPNDAERGRGSVPSIAVRDIHRDVVGFQRSAVDARCEYPMISWGFPVCLSDVECIADANSGSD